MMEWEDLQLTTRVLTFSVILKMGNITGKYSTYKLTTHNKTVWADYLPSFMIIKFIIK